MKSTVYDSIVEKFNLDGQIASFPPSEQPRLRAEVDRLYDALTGKNPSLLICELAHQACSEHLEAETLRITGDARAAELAVKAMDATCQRAIQTRANDAAFAAAGA